MALSTKLQDAINKQINAELFSAYSYLGMAAYFDANGFPGSAGWMKHQAQEEIAHAMKFYEFMNDRGAAVELEALSKPKGGFKSMRDVFAASLKQEQGVTKLIHNLFELARGEKDYAFEAFLKWFLDEQVEEEKSVADVLSKIDLIGGAGEGLYLLDRELGKRE